jgi:hypothetical protein
MHESIPWVTISPPPGIYPDISIFFGMKRQISGRGETPGGNFFIIGSFFASVKCPGGSFSRQTLIKQTPGALICEQIYGPREWCAQQMTIRSTVSDSSFRFRFRFRFEYETGAQNVELLSLFSRNKRNSSRTSIFRLWRIWQNYTLIFSS